MAMTDGRKAGRLLMVGAGLLALGATACSSPSSADSPAAVAPVASPMGEATSAAATVPVAGPTTIAPVETTAPAAPVAPTTPVDGSALLASAIAGLSTTYHFTTVITVDGSVVLSADGDHVGDGIRLALTAPAGIVNYIITPDGSWVMPDGGEWDELDSSAATSDPITALAAPTAVAVSAADGTTTTLAVTVPATAIGLASGPDVTMTCQLDGAGQLHRVLFDSTVDGKPATVTAEFGPVVDGSPVVAPI
ncbi:MAG: hypothetical protein JWN99_2043 [Ilumatobacteraceae bacterium]|nr:hypothetical protein [Ilumatobacteraceae bacterium]